jgi:N-acetylmuramoyl-L-alanine amidase
MRWLSLLSLLAALCTARPAGGADLSRLHTTPLFGSSYVRVADWAALTGFKATWLQRNKTLLVSNKWWRIEFTADSQRAVIAGTTVWLSVPFAVRDGTPYISLIDLRSVIDPILYPQKPASGAIRTVCLDPGHGGEDSGNLVAGHKEKTYTLKLAQEVRALLMKEGIKVVMTRNDDRLIGLYDRPETAARAKADLFVSLHFNGQSGGGDANGVETYCLTPPGAASTNAGGEGKSSTRHPGNAHDGPAAHLAYQVQRRMRLTLDFEDRGVRHARFAVLRQAKVPAILVEGGFLSNTRDRAFITSADGIRKLAKAVAEGILEYKRISEG